MARHGSVEATGTVMESLGGDRFRVELENGVRIAAYPCGRIRLNHIRILVGDRVLVEMSPYDLSNGRIVRRL